MTEVDQPLAHYREHGDAQLGPVLDEATLERLVRAHIEGEVVPGSHRWGLATPLGGVVPADEWRDALPAQEAGAARVLQGLRRVTLALPRAAE